MGGFTDAFKILIIPALIASAVYLLLAYLVIPIVRLQRDRYSQYVPVDTISSAGVAVRTKLITGITSLITFAFRRTRPVADGSSNRRGSFGVEDEAFGEEEGESMIGFDVTRTERSVRGGNVDAMHSDRRLSRDLEEGFRDDSEEDSADDRRGAQPG